MEDEAQPEVRETFQATHRFGAIIGSQQAQATDGMRRQSRLARNAEAVRKRRLEVTDRRQDEVRHR